MNGDTQSSKKNTNEDSVSLQKYAGTSLQRTNNLIRLTSKLLAENNFNRIKKLILRNKSDFFELLSGFYPLTEELLERFKDKWNFSELSQNELIQWSFELMEKLETTLSKEPALMNILLNNLKHLPTKALIPISEVFVLSETSNSAVFGVPNKPFLDKLNDPKKIKIIEDTLSEVLQKKYQIKIVLSENPLDCFWRSLIYNKSISWSVELIERVTDHCRLKWIWIWLSCSESLPWSIELIEKYKDKWNWSSLSIRESLPWSIKLIEKYEDKWNWEMLSRSKSLPWSIELIEKYKDKWDWKRLSKNKSLPWSSELIEKFENELKKYFFSSTTKFISEEIIEHFRIKWFEEFDKTTNKWKKSNYDWSIELIERFEDKWNWGDLSSNESLPWSIELIERFEDKLDWVNLSSNESLPWSIELINKFEDKLDWDCLSWNELLPWSIDLIKRFKDKLDWYYLSGNESLPWSIDLIQELDRILSSPYFLEKIYEERLREDGWGYGEDKDSYLSYASFSEDLWISCWESLSKNESIPWSIGLIEMFKDKWDWENLSRNESLPWSIELIEKFEDKCGIPCNKKVYDLIIPEIEKVMPLNDFLKSLD